MADPLVERLYDGVKKVWPDCPSLDAWQVGALRAHYALLRKWNPKINLVGPSTLDVAAVRHYAESLFLASRVPDGVGSVLDVGSGAGFPGFPLGVLRTGVSVTLVESDRRKAAFLRESCTVRNVRVECRRVEEVELRVDAVVTRAVDPGFVVGWGRMYSVWFGFIGSSTDCHRLAADSRLVDADVVPLPWQDSSSILWAMFHVEPA